MRLIRERAWAADEIERLEAELKREIGLKLSDNLKTLAEIGRLLAALEQIAMIQYVRTAKQAVYYFHHVAREALLPYQQKAP